MEENGVSAVKNRNTDKLNQFVKAVHNKDVSFATVLENSNVTFASKNLRSFTVFVSSNDFALTDQPYMFA